MYIIILNTVVEDDQDEKLQARRKGTTGHLKLQ
jgi:hypothetical protein